MSYRDPKTAIDTQSAKHLEKLQNSIVTGFDKISKGVVSDVKDIEDKRLKTIAATEKASKATIKYNADWNKKSDSVLSNNFFGFKFQTVAKANLAQRNKNLLKSFQTNEDAVFNQNVANMPDVLDDEAKLLGILSSNIGEDLANRDNWGGLDPNQSGDGYEVAMGFVNLNNAGYKRKIKFDATNPNGNNFTYGFTKKENGFMGPVGVERTINSFQLKQYSARPEDGLYDTIVDLRPAMKTEVEGIGLFKAGSKGVFKDTWYETEENGTLKIFTETDEDGTTRTYKKLRQDDIKSLLSSTTDSDIKSLTEKQQISMFNFLELKRLKKQALDNARQIGEDTPDLNVIADKYRKSTDFKDFGAPLTDEENIELNKLYTNYQYNEYVSSSGRTLLSTTPLKTDQESVSRRTDREARALADRNGSAIAQNLIDTDNPEIIKKLVGYNKNKISQISKDFSEDGKRMIKIIMTGNTTTEGDEFNFDINKRAELLNVAQKIYPGESKSVKAERQAFVKRLEPKDLVFNPKTGKTEPKKQ